MGTRLGFFVSSFPRPQDELLSACFAGQLFAVREIEPILRAEETVKKGECSTKSDRRESRTCGRRVAVKAVQAAGATSFSESSGHRRTLKMCLLGELAWLGWACLSPSVAFAPHLHPPSLRPLSSGIGIPLAHSAHSKPLPRSLPGTEFGAGFLFPGPFRVAIGNKSLDLTSLLSSFTHSLRLKKPQPRAHYVVLGPSDLGDL